MFIKQLKLKNFRNLSSVTISPCHTVNIIYGDNAQGKTNLIEAIWLFSGNISFRHIKIKDLMLFDSQKTTISMYFSDRKRDKKAEITWRSTSNTIKREILLNQVPIKKTSQLMDECYCTLFTPLDLELAGGSPDIRRNFLNIAISQITPQYRSYLETYQRVLQQRNALLKQHQSLNLVEDLLDIWDEQLSKLGTILSLYRKDYLEKLTPFVQCIYRGLSSEKEKISLNYHSTIFQNIDLLNNYQQEFIDFYLEQLIKTRTLDLKQGYTSGGVHRDDLILKIQGLPVKTFASRGQLRSTALTLKLAEASLIEKITMEQPIILLDDVMSELDHHRQHYLLNHIKNKQVFITCCDIFNTMALNQGKLFEIKNGEMVLEKWVKKPSSCSLKERRDE